jgi:hypothetical protein
MSEHMMVRVTALLIAGWLAVACGTSERVARVDERQESPGEATVRRPTSDTTGRIQEEFDAGVTISDDGRLVLVNLSCSDSVPMLLGSATIGSYGEFTWGSTVTGELFLELDSDNDAVMIVTHPSSAEDITNTPGDTRIQLTSVLSGFEFDRGDLDRSQVLTANGPIPVESVAEPCGPGGTSDWGVQLLADGLLEIVAMECRDMSNEGFMVSVDDETQLVWSSQYLQDFLEDGPGASHSRSEESPTVVLSPDTNRSSDEDGPSQYDYSSLDPERILQVNAVGGSHVRTLASSLEPGMVVTGSHVVPRAEVNFRCETG